MMPLDPAVVREQRLWNSAQSQAFYRTHRQTPDDLYPSERFFLPEVLSKVDSMIDVGCAAGGFASVAKHFNPRVRYVGVDIAPAFIATASADHPDAEFVLGDGLTFTTPPNSFDLAHASGVLHLNLQYRAMIAAMWRQTRRYLLCDLRLTRGAAEVGRMEGPFGEQGESSTLPYVVLTVDEAVRMFSELDPAPSRITVKGYPHAPAASVTLAHAEVIVAFFLVEKGPAARPAVDIDLNG